METTETIRTRRSVHEYADDGIPDEDLAAIFEDVRWAPSSYNLQPWEFLVCREPENQRRLRDCAYDQAHVTDAAAAVVVFGDTDRSRHAEQVFRDQAEKGYRDAESAEELIEQMSGESPAGNEEWVVQSCMIAATTFMYAAWDRGYATCPMGGWDGDAILDAFDVHDTWYPVLMMTVGCPEQDGDEWQRPRKLRRSRNDFVHHEGIVTRSD